MAQYMNELDEQLTKRIQAKQFCKALKMDVLEATGSIGNSFVEDTVNIQVDALVFSAVRAIAAGTSCEVWASSDEVQMALLCLGIQSWISNGSLNVFVKIVRRRSKLIKMKRCHEISAMCLNICINKTIRGGHHNLAR